VVVVVSVLIISSTHCDQRIIDRVRNVEIRRRCGLKDDVVTRIERGMFRWFGHVERMSDERMTKKIRCERASRYG
jgi:hypothetical protein